LTRTRDYIKEQYRPQALYKLLYGKHPTVAAGILARAKAYNDTREELLELERAGQALLVFPDQITIENRTSNVAQLQAAYDDGLAQSARELPRWKEFLGL
ncbi:MAG: patatin family protein, partial [Propionibacteriaceae bacterium]|nr:patatin family protein [Propionibacteriaceae bacterium]